MTEQKITEQKMVEPKITELTAEMFLADEETALLPYDIPGKGRVWIKRVSNLEFRQWAAANKDSADDLYNDASLIQMCVVNKDGTKMFKLEQIPKIASKFESVILPLVNVCCEYNGFGGKAESKIVKNLPKTQTKDS